MQEHFCNSPAPLHGEACTGPAEQSCNAHKCVATEPCKHMTCIHKGGMIQVMHHHLEHELGHVHHHCMWHHGMKACHCLCNKAHAVPHEHKAIADARAAMPTTRVAFLKAEELVAANSAPSVDGGWSSWSQWSRCRDASNTKIRVRSCSEPWRTGHGMPCAGEAWETKAC